MKTVYLLRYIDDETYRRRILVQLNRGEGRHQLARTVFHGRRGELRQRYREGQEDQLGSLGLVVNVIVLWNTIYMHAALDHLRAGGFDVRDEDVARLSPLGFDHINMLGRYAFTLPVCAHSVLGAATPALAGAIGAGGGRRPLATRRADGAGLEDGSLDRLLLCGLPASVIAATKALTR